MSEWRNSKILIAFYIIIYLKIWLVVQNLKELVWLYIELEHIIILIKAMFSKLFSDIVWIAWHEMFSNFLLFGQDSWQVAIKRILVIAAKMEQYIAIATQLLTGL